MGSTNYTSTFIAVAADCPATHGTVPPARTPPSIAELTYARIADAPYRYTSDDVLFEVYATRQAIPRAEWPAARVAFFAKGQPCLRASDLGKKYGWGVHSDAEGRVALYGVETPEYAALAAGRAGGTPVVTTQAMRSRR